MKTLKERFDQVQRSYFRALEAAETIDQLEALRLSYLSRKGNIAQLMHELKSLPLEEKKELGPLLNEFKNSAQKAFDRSYAAIGTRKLEKELKKKKTFDVTASLPRLARGSLHPITQVTNRVESIFMSMGFEVVHGPEVETEFYNFEALNIPKTHPARQMWDTFWLDIPGLLLRTHTSSVQIHAMQRAKPPLAIVAPGRCYRHEATDASHDFMFMQAEGLLVGHNIGMNHLLAVVKRFLQALFDKENLAIRVRPSYFPFVEPGVEIDASCPFCSDGCSVCKKTRWIEICGAGLVHPNVLDSCSIDPKHYSGFAFGFGLTRLVMLTYGIQDIRLLHQPSLAFLQQF